MANYRVVEILPSLMNCSMELCGQINDTDAKDWIYGTNEALYYIFPVILTMSLICSIISSVVSSRMAVDSHECYITGFNISVSLLLITIITQQLPNYIYQSDNVYMRILPYLPAVESWTYYCCVWLLATAVMERTAHALLGKWHASFGRIHGVIASILVIVICFVSTLPQYWEFAVTTTQMELDGSNCTHTLLAPRKDVLHKESGAYIAEYMWYQWFFAITSVLLPYIVLPIAVPPLICVPMHIYTSSPLEVKTTAQYYAAGSSLKEQLKQERSYNRMLCTVVVIFLIFAAPKNALKLMHSPPVGISLYVDPVVKATMIVISDVLFYLIFTLLFFIYLAFGTKFKTTFYELCCCRKNDIIQYY